MRQILDNLNKIGVHHIQNDDSIMLEFLLDEIPHAEEIDSLIKELLMEINRGGHKHVILDCPKQHLQYLPFTNQQMKVTGERVIYKKDLLETITLLNLKFEVWSISSKASISFLSEVMERSFNETEQFLDTMKTELPNQASKMFTVFLINHDPVGVVLPHIEPETYREGRIFWIGIHPNFRGKGFGRNLHLIGLYRLQKEFQARTYLGATEVKNIPMRNIMIANGCVHQNTVKTLTFMK